MRYANTVDLFGATYIPLRVFYHEKKTPIELLFEKLCGKRVSWKKEEEEQKDFVVNNFSDHIILGVLEKNEVKIANEHIFQFSIACTVQLAEIK